MYSTPDSPIVKHCEQCGAEFTHGNSQRKYCNGCYRSRGRQLAQRTCCDCGKQYEVVVSSSRRAASPNRPTRCSDCRVLRGEKEQPQSTSCVDCGTQIKRNGRGRPAQRCRSCKRKADNARKDGVCSRCGGPCRRNSKVCKACRSVRGANVRLEPKRCEVCGETFQPKTRKNKYCGKTECVIEGRRRSLDERLGYPNRFVCLYCGETYKAKACNRDTFCCREHAYAWRKENPVLGPLPATATELRRCEVCGNPATFGTAKTCGSEECKRTRYLEAAAARSTRDRKPRACKECGIMFVPEYGNKRRHFHSDECLRKHGQRIGKATRRSRQKTSTVERVDPYAVFGRDGWRCKLCGCRTPKRLRGTTDDRAPELDHIVPLAHGGEHSYANTQCLCRKCNQAKGASVAGQLSLL